MFAPKREFYPDGEAEVRIHFDLRIPGSVERMHRERTVWQDQSNIEALDMDVFILINRPNVVVREAA
jgi:hypothetical protein